MPSFLSPFSFPLNSDSNFLEFMGRKEVREAMKDALSSEFRRAPDCHLYGNEKFNSDFCSPEK